MLTGISPWELVIIGITFLVFFKPEQLVNITKSYVKARKEIKGVIDKTLN